MSCTKRAPGVTPALVIGALGTALLGAISAARADGETDFNTHCRTCHSPKAGDNRLGPALHGIVGKKAGTVAGYSYSPAFQSSELVWTEATLDAFIANPNAVFSGSNMATFPGLDDAALRQRIIAYLATLR